MDRNWIDTYNKFWSEYRAICEKDEKGYLRHGQKLFTALFNVDKETAEEVRGTSIDPFYNDLRESDFLFFVYEKWRKECDTSKNS